MLAGLPYVVWPVGSLFILASRKKDDPFLYYHGVQGLIWGAIVAVFGVLGLIGLAIAFRLMPGTSTYLWGAFGMGTFVGVGMLAMLVFFTAIFLGWRATEGEMLRLPFIGDYAEGKMLDHTGMTRREFMQMIEQSFIEPNAPVEPIPFPPAAAAPQLSGKAAEILAQRAAVDATPASLKAAELLAQRAAAQAQQTALSSANGASRQQPPSKAPAAPRAAAASPPAPAAPRAAAATPPAPAAPRAGSVPSSARPTPPNPQPAKAARTPDSGAAPQVKSYPLIGGAGSSQQAVPARPAPAAAPVAASGSGPQIKEVDLIRHYKERRNSAGPAAQPQTDALRQWLSSVDTDG
jgi:uncharacterized membrane protein